MTLIAILIIVLYTLLIGVFIVGFFKVKEFNSNSDTLSNSFSIIIPFRNEVENLPQLLTSISKLKYPCEKFEILLINDDSSDNYNSIIDVFKSEHSHIILKVLDNKRQSNSPKKDAIETGIQHSKFEWILTTDADCVVPNLWLQTLNSFILQNAPYLIAGPVSFSKANSFLDHFQQLDLSALIGTTIGGFGIKNPFMCNGANLCYRKDIFLKLNGFEGNNHVASGDDIFMLEKMNAQFPKKVFYLKSYDALVFTFTEKSLTSLLQQRIRWASKATSYSNWFSKFVSMLVFLTNIIFILSLIQIFILKNARSYYFMVALMKIIIDFIIIWQTLNFSKNQKSSLWYPLIAFLHPVFILNTALLSLISGKYNWKSRSFSNKQ